MSYRDGYDFRKWYDAEARERPRRYWVRWGLMIGLTLIWTTPVLSMVNLADRSALVPGITTTGMPMFLSALHSPFTRGAWISPQGFAKYDEFERKALSDAMRRAYLIDLCVIGALFLWLMAATRAGWPVPRTTVQWGSIGYSIVMTMLALPVIFAEIMVPMPDPEDESL